MSKRGYRFYSHLQLQCSALKEILLVILGNCNSLTCIFTQTILLRIISLSTSKLEDLFILLHLLKKGVAQKARQITLNPLPPGRCKKFTSFQSNPQLRKERDNVQGEAPLICFLPENKWSKHTNLRVYASTYARPSPSSSEIN